MKVSNRFYVYVVFRSNGIPCYVGKGQGKRWLNHQYKSCNSHLRNIAAKAGGALPIVILQDNMIESEAFAAEVAFIAAIGRKDLGKGPLVNRTNGGEGVSGISEESRAALALRMSLRMKGTSWPDERREKLSKTKTGVRASPEHIAAAKAGIARAGSRKGQESHFGGIRTGPLTEKNIEGIRAGVSAYWANGGVGHRLCRCITDGKTNTRIYGDTVIPEGWRLGVTLTEIQRASYASNIPFILITDGVKTVRFYEETIPEGWCRGMTKKKRELSDG